MAEASKDFAKLFLEKEFGMTIREIPTATTPRADLEATDGSERFLIEVKEKFDRGNHSEFSELTVLRNQRVIMRGDPHAPLPRLANILRKGDEQIRNTPGHENCFNLLWIHIEGPSADMLGRRLLYTFYGIADLVPKGFGGKSVNCLYFDYSAAYTMPLVHALVISENRELQIAINEFAVNVEQFRSTQFVQRFGRAKYDPLDYESDKSKVLLRSDIPRKHEAKVLAEVKRQTGVEYYRAPLTRYTVDSVVDPPADA